MYTLQFYQHISRNNYSGLLLQFSNHLGLTAKHKSSAQQSSLPQVLLGAVSTPVKAPASALLPLGSNLTMMLCRTQGKWAARQMLSHPFIFLLRCKTQKTREIPVFPSLSLYWSPAALQSALRWIQGFHPHSAGFPRSVITSRLLARGKPCSRMGRELRMSFGLRLVWVLNPIGAPNDTASRTFTLLMVTFPVSPALFLPSILFCLLCLNFRALLPRDIYIKQSCLDCSPSWYFGEEELLFLPACHCACRGAISAEFLVSALSFKLLKC